MSASGTALESLGESLFARDNVYEGAAFANHCRRLAALGGLLMRASGLEVQPGALELLSYTHDLGLLRPELPGPSYMHRSLAVLKEGCAEHFGEEGGAFGFSALELEEMMLLNHRVLPVPGSTRVAELYRRAVWVEHTRGLARFGLSHTQVQGVFQRYPRLDLDRVLLDFGRRTIRKEPLSLVRGVFFGTHPAS